MDERIAELKARLDAELSRITEGADLENLRVEYLGKKGSVTELLKGLKDLSNEEKKTFGQKVNS